jgi:hypothetical protein
LRISFEPPRERGDIEICCDHFDCNPVIISTPITLTIIIINGLKNYDNLYCHHHHQQYYTEVAETSPMFGEGDVARRFPSHSAVLLIGV